MFIKIIIFYIFITCVYGNLFSYNNNNNNKYKRNLRININSGSWLNNNIFIDYFNNNNINKKNIDRAILIYKNNFDKDDKNFTIQYIKDYLDRLNYELYKSNIYNNNIETTYKKFELIHHFINETNTWNEIFYNDE